MNCDKEPGWHMDTWRHQSTRQTLRTRCHNCHKPTVTIVRMLTADLHVSFGGDTKGVLAGRCTYMHERTHSFTSITCTHRQSSKCPSVKIWPKFAFCSNKAAFESPSIHWDSAWPAHSPTENTICLPPGKPLKSQHHIPQLFAFSVCVQYLPERCWPALNIMSIYASLNKYIFSLYHHSSLPTRLGENRD